jgi:polysaccharide pyruvyl transferase WcaK-like protein
LSALRQLRCSKIAYGMGINQLARTDETQLNIDALPATTLQLIDHFVEQLDLVSVRDESIRIIVDRKLRDRVYITGDPALFYRAEDRREAPAKPLNGRPATPSFDVSVNFALHGPASAANLSTGFAAYAKFLRELASQYHIRYHYVQHSDTERIIPLMLSLCGIRVRRHDVPAERLCSTYRQFDLNICQMLHSSILSLNVGVPTLTIAYDVKSYSFFELMGLPEYCVARSPFEPLRALAAARKALEEGEAYRRSLALRKQQLHQILEKFLEQVATLVARRPLGVPSELAAQPSCEAKGAHANALTTT